MPPIERNMGPLQYPGGAASRTGAFRNMSDSDRLVVSRQINELELRERRIKELKSRLRGEMSPCTRKALVAIMGREHWKAAKLAWELGNARRAQVHQYHAQRMEDQLEHYNASPSRMTQEILGIKLPSTLRRIIDWFGSLRLQMIVQQLPAVIQDKVGQIKEGICYLAPYLRPQ